MTSEAAMGEVSMLRSPSSEAIGVVPYILEMRAEIWAIVPMQCPHGYAEVASRQPDGQCPRGTGREICSRFDQPLFHHPGPSGHTADFQVTQRTGHPLAARARA